MCGVQKVILIVVNEPWFFISHRLPIARAASENGYDVHIATRNGVDVEKIKSEGFEFHEIPFSRSSMNLLEELRSVVKLYRLYADIRPSLVHHVTIKPVLYGSLVARLSGVPRVINAISGLGHVFTDDGFSASIRRLLIGYAYRFLLRKNNQYHVIFQNPDDRRTINRLAKLKDENVTMIPGSGVDLGVYSQLPEPVGVPVVVLAARMLWDKGIGEFVKAAEILTGRGVEVNFILAGDVDEGNPRSISKDVLLEWSKRENIQWLGYQSDIPLLYAKANIICLPSYYGEGVPKSLIEAAACGRAIVTTNEPGCREIVQDGVNGILVESKNPVELAESIEELIMSPALRNKMGLAGRKLVEDRFSLDLVVNRTLNVYKALLA